MISLEAERIFGFQGGERPVFAAAANGEYVFSSSVGVMVANTDPTAEQKLWIAGDGVHQIGNLEFNPNRSIIVVTERRLKVALIVFSYPQKRQIQRIADIARIDVADMRFSRDGTMFAVLADAPQCTLSLFSVDASNKLSLLVQTTKPHVHLYQQLSFSPRSDGTLCASGGGHVAFWHHDTASKTLVQTEGKVTSSHVRLTAHAWLPNGDVACGSANGDIFAFNPESPSGRQVFQVVGGESGEAATSINSILVSRQHIVIGCSDGAIRFVDHQFANVQFVVRSSLPNIQRMVFTPEWHSILIGDKFALGLVHLPGYEDVRHASDDGKRQTSRTATLQMGASGEAVGACHHKGTVATVISKNGNATTVDYAKSSILNTIHVGEGPLVARRFGDTVFAVTSQTGTLRIVDYNRAPSSAVVIRAKLSDSPLVLCEVNRLQSRLLASDGRLIAFFKRDKDDIVFEGVVKVNTVGPATLLQFVEGFGGFLLVQANGDVSLYSAPFFDDSIPESPEGLKEISSEQLFVNSWRLDFPPVTLAVCALHDEAINILVHSLDKETKLYILDRTLSADRKDRESKAIKPQLTMKDHEKKGTGWMQLRGKYSVSLGADGRLVLRDTAAYLGRMAPTPPSKEKRDPICSVVRHASMKGGIVGIGCSDDEARFITTGADGYLIVWTVGKQSPLPPGQLKIAFQTPNKETEDSIFFGEKHRLQQQELDRLRHQDERSAVAKSIERLRDRLQQIRHENEVAPEEEKVPLQDFLVDQQRAQFEEQCAIAVQEMADTEHFANLNRDYVTTIIKKECWDVMEVKLTKLKALSAPAVVNNFHERKVPPQDLVLLRKLKFLRLVEMRDAEVRGTKYLQTIRERNPNETDGDSAKADAAAAAVTEAEPLCVGKKTLELEALEDPKPFLYNHLTVFTKHRAIIQLTLLKGRTLCLRSSFNKLFTDLVGRKKQDLIKMEERNVRCRQVLKELDEDRPVFAPGFSKEEDPKNVFDVADSEVPADKFTDPDEKKRLATEAEEKRKWIERHGSDDSADKALKAWMDGRLEKEVRTLDIKIDKPEFADDTSEKYVVLEERSEDQQRIFREYEKAVQKRIEEVAARRAALQAEFTQLQKENIEQAKKFDALVSDLFQKRLIAQQQCFEVELSQVKLAQCVLLQNERSRLGKRMEESRQTASELHARAVRATQAARGRAHALQQKLEHLREDEKNKEKNLRQSQPFSDPEWGEALVRIYTKKKPKKPEHKGKKEEKRAEGDSHQSHELNADPYSYVEEEQRAKARRYAEDPQFQVARLDQGDIPNHIWDSFQRYRQERVNAERDIAMLGDDLADLQKEVEACESTEQDMEEKERIAFEQFEQFQKDSLQEQFDVDELHTFRQGQVEVEQAPVVTDYADAILINSSQILRFNRLIRESGGEKMSLMREINEKKKEIRMIEWEMEHLQYNMHSLEMELRHLHTLRVTKQMQEYINGGGEDHNEKERSKLIRHIEHVQTSMTQKIEDRRQQILKLKRSVKDKELENMLLLDQVAECKGLVDERKSIRDLQSAELDAERTNKLMKDMRTTRKLEDVAKAQQEEMLLNKKEIDRLRERTFPSFAVVSKRVVGNPDQR